MKVLITGDWHADWSTVGVPRYGDVAEAVAEAVGTAIGEVVDAFIFLGDLTDPDSGPAMFDAMELAGETARELHCAGIQSIWIAGNHDVVEDGTGRTTLRPALGPLANLTQGGDRTLHRRLVGGHGDVHLVEQPQVIIVKTSDGEEGFVVGLPFTATSHRYDPAEFVRNPTGLHALVKKTSPVIIAGHLSIDGAQIGDETTEMPRGRDVSFPVDAVADFGLLARVACCNGHYHRRQFTRGIHVPGSLARLTFGEVNHEPGFLILEV